MANWLGRSIDRSHELLEARRDTIAYREGYDEKLKILSCRAL